MNVKINYKGHDRGAQALVLDELAAALKNDDFNCKVAGASSNAGEKGDVATGLIIAGLAVQSMGALISALTFYFSGRPSYTVTIKRGAAMCAIGNLSAESATKILEAEISTNDVEVEISEER
jgi:hypothetical protein